MTTDGLIILTRALQLAPALMLFGAVLFARGAAHPHRVADTWSRLRPVLLALTAIALLATAGWLLAEAASFAEDPRQPLTWPALRVVLFETRFGRVALLRLVLLVATLPLLLRLQPTLRSLGWLCVPTATAVASFVGTGHGTAPGGAIGSLHALSDAVHLWLAAIWLGALLSLWLLALDSRDEVEAGGMADALRRFSAIGPGVVTALALTGVVNSRLLLGAAPWQALIGSPYGHALLLKLVLFVGMLACAAVNRYALAPQLAASVPATATALPALRWLRAILGLETLLGLGVIGAVAWLGALAPPG